MSTVDDFFVMDPNMSMKKVLGTGANKLIQSGDIIEGVITEIYPDEVRVDINSKSEGSLPLDEIKDPATNQLRFKKGDKLVVYVIFPETADGKMLLSYAKAQVEQLWFELEEHHKKNSSIAVKIIEANRGGLIGVYRDNIRGFIPLSQLTTHHRPKIKKGQEGDPLILDQLRKLITSTLTVRIIEIDAKRNRLIFSERAASIQNPNLINDIKVGQQMSGKISNIMKFGLFIDLGGFDGFVHISEVSWNRITPDDLFSRFKIGDEVKIIVIDINEKVRRVSLSIKQLEPNPWSAIASKYYVGQLVEGTVSAIADFGVFIELEKHFEGLLYMADFKRKEGAGLKNNYQIGQKLKVKISSIDTEKKRLGLVLATEGGATTTLGAESSPPASEGDTVPKPPTALLVAERDEAIKQFTTLEGVGKTTAQRLYEAGYKNLSELAKASMSELSLVPGIRRSLADKIIQGAQGPKS